MTSFLKSAMKIRLEVDSSLFFLRSRQNVGHPNRPTQVGTGVLIISYEFVLGSLVIKAL